MSRVSEVIDCWFDSGSMPFAQWHYPFENKDVFEKNFPADFISEAIDQTRGWFYTLMAISTLIFGKAPYKNVVVLGHVQDKNGRKMSKRLGNAANPRDALAAHGADAVRWYFYTGSQPWLPSRFSGEAVGESARKYMGTLWNAYAFFVLYANIDGFSPAAYDKKNLAAMDRWLLSRLNTLVKDVDANLADYKITEAGRAMAAYADELSNWYIRRCRERFWAAGMEKDKTDAYNTLYAALTTLAKLSAPLTPFISEQIYRNLRGADEPESVHLCDFPAFDGALADEGLESKMEATRRIVELGRAARSEAGIKNRQPLKEMFAQGAVLDGEFKAIIEEELNVKAVTFVTDASRFSSYKFKPQLKTLGPKYGRLLGGISAWLARADGNELMARLKSGAVSFEIDGQTAEITIDDVIYETARVDGYVSCAEGGFAVALDTALDEGLIEEGFVREVISKIQTMRKEAGFEVTDRIVFSFEAGERLAGIIGKNADEIAGQTLSGPAKAGISPGGYEKEWLVNGEDAKFSVARAGA
jgi:isoleucyl-tRNA synthetase